MFKKSLYIAVMTLTAAFFCVPSATALVKSRFIMPGDLDTTPVAVQNPECVTPTIGMVITEDTTFCPGTYDLPRLTNDLMRIAADNVTIDCSGATISIPEGSNDTTGWNMIRSSNYSNFEIANCTFNNNPVPITVFNSEQSSIHDCEFNMGTVELHNFNHGSLYNLTKQADARDRTFLGVWTSSYNQVYGNTIHGDGVLGNPYMDTGIYLSYAAGNNVYGNTVENSDIAIQIDGLSYDNTVTNNTILNSPWNGIIVWPYFSYVEPTMPYNNTIQDNILTGNYRDIVVGPGVHDNTFENNTMVDAQDKSIYLWHDDGFTVTEPAIGNQFINNQILGSAPTGIEIMPKASVNAYFEGNTIADRQTGIMVGSQNDGTGFVLNDMRDNGTSATNDDASTYFDNGTSGNYWSDYDEPSEGCTDANADGVCDLPYTGILGSGGVADNYALTGAPVIQTIADQTIAEGDMLQLTVTASDPNDPNVAFDVQYPSGDFGAFLADNGNNTATFAWKPWYDQAGADYDVIITAFDGTHTSEAAFTIDVTNTIVPPPTTSLDVSTQSVVAGQPFTLTVGGSSAEALKSVWWGVREPGTSGFTSIPGSVNGTAVNLSAAQDVMMCNGQTYCEYTRTVIIDNPGNYEIWANARDTIYFSVIGEPHQASEGIGMAVSEINVAPAFASLPSSVTVMAGQVVNLPVSASDENGDALTLSMIGSIPGANFTTGATTVNADGTSAITGTFSWTPSRFVVGNYIVQFQVSDENGAVTTSPAVEIVVRGLTTAIAR